MSDQGLPQSSDSSPESSAHARLSDSDRRINLINRRSAAYLLEIALIQIILVPLFAAIFVYFTQDPNASGWLVNLLIWVPYILIRDILGVCSWGKRVVGLKVESDSDEELTTGRLVLRNAALCIPLFPIIEFIKAYKGDDPKMRRFGDKWAKTRVVARDPSSIKGKYQGPLIGALALFYIAHAGSIGLAAEYYRIIASMGAAHEASQTHVTEVTTSIAGYTVEVPKAAQLKDNAVAGALESKLYVHQGGSLVTAVFQASQTELTTNTPQQFLKMLAGQYKPPQYTNIKVAETTANKRPVLDVKALYQKNGAKIHMHLRHIIAGSKVYQLAISWAVGQKKAGWQQKAWDSFKLTDQAPPETLEDAMKQAKGNL